MRVARRVTGEVNNVYTYSVGDNDIHHNIALCKSYYVLAAEHSNRIDHAAC